MARAGRSDRHEGQVLFELQTKFRQQFFHPAVFEAAHGGQERRRVTTAKTLSSLCSILAAVVAFRIQHSQFRNVQCLADHRRAIEKK